MSKEAEELRWEQEVLQQKYNEVSRERDEIQASIPCVLYTVLQQKYNEVSR